MKKLTIILSAIFSVVAMAAQKPCGEVFPNAGVKTTLGINGSRCAVSKTKTEGVSEITNKLMVSHDNSTFKYALSGWLIKNGEKITKNMTMECEDIGAGITFECKGTIEGKSFTETNDIRALGAHIFSQAFSKTDLYYLFGSPLPWETVY